MLSIPSIVAILPDFLKFLPISSKLDHLCRFSRHPTLPMVVLTLSPTCLLRTQGQRFPVWWQYSKITMNSSQFRHFDHLYRFSHHPTFPIAVLALCLPPAHSGPREADSQCSGNIASFRWIYSNLIKNYLIISWYLHVRNGVAVAPYVRLASRSQAKFQNNGIESHSGFRAHPHLRRAWYQPVLL